MTNTSNGGNTVYFNLSTPNIDTDLRVRVLGLAASRSDHHDPVSLAERMLAFVEGRADAPDSEVEIDTDEFDEDEYEDAFDDWYRDVANMLGKTVRVTLATNEDGTKVISEGVLIGFGQGGDFEVLEEDGFVHYCWPMLEIQLVEDDS